MVSMERLTLCLVGGIIGRMENNGWKMVWKTVFSTVWEAKENREDGKFGRKFSFRTHQFFSSQIGRKTVERKLLLTWNYTNALSHLPSSQTQRLSWNQVKKKKKKPETESWKKRERKHFLNEGEKERKEGGDREIRKNVYGGRRKKKKKKPERASWRRLRKNESAGTCVENKKKKG